MWTWKGEGVIEMSILQHEPYFWSTKGEGGSKMSKKLSTCFMNIIGIKPFSKSVYCMIDLKNRKAHRALRSWSLPPLNVGDVRVCFLAV